MDNNNTTSTHDQALQPPKNGTGLRSPNLLAKYPMIGLIMFLTGCLIFAALAVNFFANGPLLTWDNTIANTLPAIGLKSPPYIKTIMDTGFYVGDYLVIALVILLDIYFLYKRYWQEFVMVTFGFAGSTLLFYILSNLIARHRPLTQIWIIEKIPGFPSGHAVAVVVFYGLLAYFLVPKMPSVFWKVVVIVATLLIIGFVGFTRIFTGGHYLTDVLAGYAVGIAWAGLFYTLVELYFQRRRQNVKTQ